MPASSDRPRRLQNCLLKDLGDEYLCYDPDGESLHVLNATARELYLLCDGEHTVDSLVRAMLERYAIDESTARADVQETLGRLSEIGLVSVA